MNKMKSGMNRRSFLRRAAGSCLLAGVPSIVPSSVFGATAPSNRLNTAMIGVGGMGGYHLRELLQYKDYFSVVALCDVKRQQLAINGELARLSPENLYNDFEEVLARKDVDAVVISTPDHWHVPLGIASLKAGKAVYLQKPISKTVAEGRSLVEVQKRYGGTMQIGSQQRSMPGFRKVAEWVRNGVLGEITQIEVGLEKPYYSQPGLQPFEAIPDDIDYDRWLGPAPYKPYSPERVIHFRANFDYAGGYYADWGAHHFDIVQWALGMDQSGPVYVDGKGVFHDQGIFNVPMEYEVHYRYANGIPMHASEKFENGIRFIGTKGWVFVSRERMEAEPRSLLSTTLKASDIHYRVTQTHSLDFYESVKTGRDPIVTVETGHRSATVCHIGNVSMRLGRPLQWDPVAERFVNDDEANRYLNEAAREPWGISL